MSKNILWTAERLKNAIGNDLIYIDNNYNYKIDNVVFDNRKIKDCSLFIAKKGETNDGHNFIEDSLQKHSQVVVLANYDFSDKIKNNPRIILVKDTIKAMEKMAKYAREDVKGSVIGITGSFGKTTTKELFNSCLSNFGKTFCNIMSFNNYIGVMTTLCNLPIDTDYAIIEMGMNVKGEIEKLSEIVKPNITIILNVASAHIAFFKEEKDIAYAKSEIFTYQKKDGFTILNKDCKYFDIIQNEANKNGITKIFSFSENNNSDIVLKNYYKDDETNLYKVKYLINDNIIEYSLTSPDYNVAVNLMSLLVLMKILNLDYEKIRKNVESFGTPQGRNNIEEADFDGKHITIINGTYNAVNPLVFIRGLELMDKIYIDKKIKRRIAIFGDIREAGSKSEEFMMSLRQPILDHKIDFLIGVGEIIKTLCNSLEKDINVKYFKESSLVVPIIKDFLEDGDLVFIKASKGIKTWIILDEITGLSTEIFL